MRKYNIICPIRKANPYKRIAKATKEHTVVPNILNREFKQNITGKVMLTDITYMPYGNNKMTYFNWAMLVEFMIKLMKLFEIGK